MPKKSDSQLATLKDLQGLSTSIATELQGFASMIMAAMQDLEERMITRIDSKIHESEGRTLLAIENLRHDMINTHADKITQHEDRIVRIEKHLHLAA